jgi:hypothetical protein
VRLYTRNGNDFTKRFPLVVAAVATLPVHSCLIDGEAIVSDNTLEPAYATASVPSRAPSGLSSRLTDSCPGDADTSNSGPTGTASKGDLRDAVLLMDGRCCHR